MADKSKSQAGPVKATKRRSGMKAGEQNARKDTYNSE
jgi:hypothetical protein